MQQSNGLNGKRFGKQTGSNGFNSTMQYTQGMRNNKRTVHNERGFISTNKQYTLDQRWAKFLVAGPH